jgi:membrane protease YdiL (CAAX protease family)
MMRRTSKKIPALILHFIIFYAFWACWAVFIRPALKSGFGSTLLTESLFEAFKVLVWAVPALLLVKKFEPEMFVGLRQMFTQKVPLKAVLIWTLIFFAVCGGTTVQGLLHGTAHINPDFWKASTVYLFAVGISEEAVFRGWILNATAKNERDLKAIALNAVLFLSIHIPGWYHKGMLASAFTGFGFLSILLFSVLASICFLKHKNLLLPVFLHMFYDFMLDFVAA